jgi:hypothetical protein
VGAKAPHLWVILHKGTKRDIGIVVIPDVAVFCSLLLNFASVELGYFGTTPKKGILFKFHGEQIFAQKGPSVFSIEWYYLI